MLRNYLIIAWRNLARTRAYSFINITGLAVGMAVALLIGLWVYDEVSFNKNFTHYDRIAQLYHHVKFGDDDMTISDVPAPIGAYLKQNVPEIEDVAMETHPVGHDHVITHGETTMPATGMFVDPAFLRMFNVLGNDTSTASLAGIHAVVMARSLATDLVGPNAVGKTIRLDNRDELMITAVFDDFPANSHFANIKILMPLQYYFSLSDHTRNQRDSWEAFAFSCYVQLRGGATFEAVSAKAKTVLYDHASGDGKSLQPQGMLFAMPRWHLYDDFDQGLSSGSRIRYVRMFTVIGVFVLLLACINFMNLSTARSEKRSREVGIRKVMGSVRQQLVRQFMSESMLVVLMAFMVALLIAASMLPWFNMLAGKKMMMPWTNVSFIAVSLAFIVITGLLAGSYPALYLSSFNPVAVLKGTYRSGRAASLPRSVMVVFQFTTSIVLMVGTAVVFLQISHGKNRPVGFDREGIIYLQMTGDGLGKVNYNTLQSALLATGMVDNMATSDFPITGQMSADASLTWEGKDPGSAPLFAMNFCSHDFPKANGFQFVQGRDFSRDFATDSSAMVINEMAAELLGGNVLGKKMTFGDNKSYTIVGVIKDQVRWSPFTKQSPHLYYVSYNGASLTVRLKAGKDVHAALKAVEGVVKRFDPRSPFDYKFIDDDYARLFTNEERTGKLATVFSVLAVFISAIGIFGLAAFAASRRIKEIGIRKVMGASAFSLWRTLSFDFIRLVVLAIVVAVPLAYFLADAWLKQYTYRIEVAWWIFAGAGGLALVITLTTVSFQAIRAAMLDPVASLKAE